MDPSAGRDPAMEGTAESAQPEQELATPRLHSSARPSASEPSIRGPLLGLHPTALQVSLARSTGVHHRVSHRGSNHLAVAPQSIAAVAAMGLAIICLKRILALLVTNPPEVGEPSAHRERDPLRSALRVDLQRGGEGGRGRLGAAGILGAANNPPGVRTRLVLAAAKVGGMVQDGARTVPVVIQPGSATRANFARVSARAGGEGPVPHRLARRRRFHTQQFSFGGALGRPAAFSREDPIVPPPTRAGRDPMLTMCRMLNLAEACEGVPSLQMHLEPVSVAPAGVAPLARTFPRHVDDLVAAAGAGTPVETLHTLAAPPHGIGVHALDA
ncbi:unnamed protein product [Closterium sp. NIES-65]|nr:unnamed protein product [Closterium sp. NIES-65]